jgi:SAM-dependent methyltransferase
MDRKEINLDVYNKFAKRFGEQNKDFLEYIYDYAVLFLNNLPGKRILDLGSGSGRDSQFFKKRGYNPLCFDISFEMIKLCKEKGLEAQIGDLEHLPFKDSSFDGVWACASLLHTPKKKLNRILAKINNILSNNGIFYLGMKKGNFEGLIKSDRYSNSKRFFALYENQELKRLLNDSNFKILYHKKHCTKDATFLNYLAKKLK